jgi:PTH1 family peptidyl-tRNA hydrolase
MNNSGISILSIADYFNIENKNIIIIHDDLDLRLGAVKFKKGGGDGGHNGLASIDKHIGKDYIRVRIGIGKPQQKSEVTNWVLGDFSKEEFKLIFKIMNHITKSIDALQNLSLEEVKTKFTIKS